MRFLRRRSKNLHDAPLKRQKKKDEKRLKGKGENTKSFKKFRKATQDIIGYEGLFENGVCAIGDGLFSSTIKFSDINYTEADREDKIDVFSQYCDFLNSFDSNIHLQLTIFNRHTDIAYFKQKRLMPLMRDKLNEVRKAYNRIFLNKVTMGENNVLREKYITITVETDTLASAVVLLARECEEALSHFKSMGVEGDMLSGAERLELMGRMIRPHEPFFFDYLRLMFSGLKTKDFITPCYLDFKNKSRIGIDDESYTQTVAIYDLSTEIADKVVSDLMEIPTFLTFTLHLDAVEKDDAIKLVKQKLAGMDLQKRDETKKLIKDLDGVYDESLLPRDLLDSKENAEKMLKDLRDGDQKMFRTAILVNVYGKSLDELVSTGEQIKRVFNRYSCSINRLIDFQTEGLNATLPIGRCELPVRRTLDTKSVGIFIPFTTQELVHDRGLYRGINQASKNLIYFDRNKLMNGNGFVLAESGGGKSFSIKDEISQLYLTTDDDIIVIDPEREYQKTSDLLNGEIIQISANSNNYINLFDITMDYGQGENPVELKAEYILTIMTVLIGGRHGLTSEAESIIDRVVREIYEDYFKKPSQAIMPTFKEFYQTLKLQPEPEAQNIALALEIYVDGSLSVFSHQTNVNVDNRLVIYDIKDLGNKLMSMGLLIALDQVWNRISRNRKLGKRTWIYIDEVYLLFKNEHSAEHLFRLYKRVRKWGGRITSATQNVEDVLLSDTARRMLSNSQYVLMLSQAKSDRDELAELFGLSDKQLKYVTNAPKGTGILRAGKNIVPFDNRIDREKDALLFNAFETDIDNVRANQFKGKKKKKKYYKKKPKGEDS